MLGPCSATKGVVKTLGASLASLAAWCYNCPCTSSGYQGTPTLVHRQEPPGLGHTRCRALLGQALTVHGHAWPGSRCSLTPYPSRLPQVARAYRGVVGGEVCEACVTLAACAGLGRAGTRHVAHDSFSPKKGRNARSLFKWRETSRRGFRGARSPRSRVRRGRLSPARPPRGLHALGVAAVEAGSRAGAGRGSG